MMNLALKHTGFGRLMKITGIKVMAETVPEIMTKLNSFYPDVVILHGE